MGHRAQKGISIMLFNTKPGAPIVWGIGNRAQSTYDEHPGILVGIEQNSMDDRERRGTVAKVILLRTRLDGTMYLAPAKILEQYVDDRFESVPELDRPLEEVVKSLLAQRRDFFTRGDGLEVGESEAAIEVASTVSDDLPL